MSPFLIAEEAETEELLEEVMTTVDERSIPGEGQVADKEQESSVPAMVFA